MPFPFPSGSAQGTNTNTTAFPLGRLWLKTLLFLSQEPTFFVPRWCHRLIAGGGDGGLCVLSLLHQTGQSV